MATEYTTLCCQFCGSTYPAKQFHTCTAFKEAVREIAAENASCSCPACGEIHQHRQICPDLRKALVRLNAYEGATETRVREIVREEIAKAYGCALDVVKNCARDDALEDAARIAHSWNPSHYHKAAQEIRALKSQPAAPDRSMEGVEMAPPLSYYGVTKQPAAQAPHDDMEGKGPCGGKRCWKTPEGHWIHSSKSYGTCSEIKSKPEVPFNLYVNPAAQAISFKCPACAVEFHGTHECARWDAVQRERDELRAAKAKAVDEAFDAKKWRDEARAQRDLWSDAYHKLAARRDDLFAKAEKAAREANKALDEIEEALTRYTKDPCFSVGASVRETLQRIGRLK